MPVEELIAQIEEDANHEIDEVIKEAKAEANRKIRDAEREAKEESKRIKQRAEKRLENRKSSELSRMRHEVKKEILKRKEELISECFEKAREKLKKLSGKEYLSLVKSVVEKSIKGIDKENCIALLSRDEDRKIAGDLGLEIGKQKIKAIGGMVIKSRDGRISVNCTFDDILKRKESEIRAKIGRILFGET